MGGSKAPSDDGFPAIFFQKSWETVKDSMFQVVDKISRGEFHIDDVDHTLIVLIPKVDKPKLISQFRPISLCNVIYKCVSKIIVNRLKEFLPSWISPLQASFVLGRSIHDNIIVAQEMLHSMRRINGKKSYMAIKIGLEKAYDKVSWSVVNDILGELNIPKKFRKLIMACVESTTVSIVWNGKIESFKSSRGLRQVVLFLLTFLCSTLKSFLRSLRIEWRMASGRL